MKGWNFFLLVVPFSVSCSNKFSFLFSCLEEMHQNGEIT